MLTWLIPLNIKYKTFGGKHFYRKFQNRKFVCKTVANLQTVLKSKFD